MTTFESEQRRYDNMMPENAPVDKMVYINGAINAIELAFGNLQDDVEFYNLDKAALKEFFDAVDKKIKELKGLK